MLLNTSQIKVNYLILFGMTSGIIFVLIIYLKWQLCTVNMVKNQNGKIAGQNHNVKELNAMNGAIFKMAYNASITSMTEIILCKMTQKTPSTTWLRYLFYRKNKLIGNEIITSNSVILELKDGRKVNLEMDKLLRRKVLLT